MTRILPGVEIEVIKEIVPQQLNPSGIAGMIGTSEKGLVLTPTRAGSYKEFTEKFGSNYDYTLTNEVKLAFQNGIYEVVVMRVMGSGGKKAELMLKDVKGRNSIRLEAKSEGEAGNNIKVKVEKSEGEGKSMLSITDGSAIEIYEIPEKNGDIASKIFEDSKIVAAEASGKGTPDGEGNLSGGSGGKSPELKSYEEALEKLESESDVDIIVACDVSAPAVHAAIDAHCKNMSKDAKNRIGVGTVGKDESVDDIAKRTNVLASDRFVLAAPYGNAGAVAGLIGNLNYYDSPTFKPLTGVSELRESYSPTQLRKLLTAGVLALEAQKGRGIIVVKGISTSKEQISVTRIADHAVRGVKNVSDNFIGTLNSPSGRLALKEKLREFLELMEKEGAIVPSTDLTEPAFIIDVYSSEADFAQGIVRVDMAVRPVRAIDYIYATILVEA